MPDETPADPARALDDCPGAMWPGGPDLHITEEFRHSAWAELLRSLADECGCDLNEVSPGRFMMRRGATADELDRDRPIRP